MLGNFLSVFPSIYIFCNQANPTLNWVSEASLLENGEILAAIEELDKKNLTYVKDGAKWFYATNFGDDQDQVLIRAPDLDSVGAI